MHPAARMPRFRAIRQLCASRYAILMGIVGKLFRINIAFCAVFNGKLTVFGMAAATLHARTILLQMKLFPIVCPASGEQPAIAERISICFQCCNVLSRNLSGSYARPFHYDPVIWVCFSASTMSNETFSLAFWSSIFVVLFRPASTTLLYYVIYKKRSQSALPLRGYAAHWAVKVVALFAGARKKQFAALKFDCNGNSVGVDSSVHAVLLCKNLFRRNSHLRRRSLRLPGKLRHKASSTTRMAQQSSIW